VAFAPYHHGCDEPVPMSHPHPSHIASIAPYDVLHGRVSQSTSVGLHTSVLGELTTNFEILVNIPGGLLPWGRIRDVSKRKGVYLDAYTNGRVLTLFTVIRSDTGFWALRKANGYV